MGRKSRSKEYRRELRSSPELVHLVTDFFSAKDELKSYTATSFCGQLITEASINQLLFEEADRLGISQEQIVGAAILEIDGTLS